MHGAFAAGENVTMELGEDYPELRESVRRVCARYPGAYWRGLDAKSAYPTEFIKELTDSGFLAALEVGVRSFDASLGGLGGCPWAPGATGNIVMEDTAFMLETMGFDTGIDLERLIGVRRKVEGLMPDIAFHGDLPKAGIPKNYVPRLTAAA